MESGRVRPLVNCTLSRVTAITPTTAVVAPTVAAGPGSITRAFGVAAGASPYNAAFTVSYSKDAEILNVGANPIFSQYGVVYDAAKNQSTLQMTDLLGRTAPAVLAESIINLQAQYGVDTDNDGIIDSWQTATGLWAAGAITRQQITQIKAVRVGIVARSGLLEKVDPATNACNVTPAAPVPLPAVAGATPAKPAGPAMSVAALPANWQCYRYKTYETVIPVRNAVMSAVKAL
jgi:type IV pilus assembly protein PilW